MRRVNVTMPDGLHRRVRFAAAAKDVPVSKYIIDAIKRQLELDGADVRQVSGQLTFEDLDNYDFEEEETGE